MRRASKIRKTFLAVAVSSALASQAAHAVSLNPDGFGQALIYPYYTVRSIGGNAFHTYVSIGNSTADAKALRVRFREGRNGREVLAFNLYLGANDMWAGAVVPTADGTQLLTTDASCTDPPFASGAIAFRRDQYVDARADGMGDTLDRTREGFIEILEMATLFGEAAAAVSHNAAGVPVDCGYIRGTSSPLVARPTGGLWGTLTLINVNGGQDFTLDATALADLASRPYYRPPSDPYPDFNAAEIDPVSNVLKRGYDRSLPPIFPENANFLYRSTWSRPVDAVSAVLMAAYWHGEYVLDANTLSATDLVITMPTRQHYDGEQGPVPPFQGPAGWSRDCSTPGSTALLGNILGRLAYNNESRASTFQNCADLEFPSPCPAQTGSICATTGVASMVTRERTAPENAASTVFGSTTLGLARGDWRIITPATSGTTWLLTASNNSAIVGLSSLPSSVRVNLDSGQTVTGRHTFFGLPVVGFFARTFNNGQLSCAGASCQGIYGSASPMRYMRFVNP